MDRELLELCKQPVTRYSFVSYDEHNDFTWTNIVTSQHVVLTDVTPSLVLNPSGGQTILSGMIVKSSDDLTTYVLGIDYTIDYVEGKIVRTALSNITTGSTVHLSYSWQTINIFSARVEYKNTIMRDKFGQEVVSTCQIYCNGDTVITEVDKIVVSGTTRVDPEIIAIQKNADENGVIDHIVIYTN